MCDPLLVMYKLELEYGIKHYPTYFQYEGFYN